MTTFTKWFIINAVVLTALVLAQSKGLITVFLKNDISYMCLLIGVLYIGFSGFCGFLSRELDILKTKKPSANFLNKIRTVEFVADNFTSLGLLGTTIGISYMMYQSLTQTSDVGMIIQGLKTGCSTAFFVTIFGILANILLNTQLLLIKNNNKVTSS